MQVGRRKFLHTVALDVGAATLRGGDPRHAIVDVPVRALTRGPKHHWFGYYDKSPVDRTGRYLLAHESDFAGRQPRPAATLFDQPVAECASKPESCCRLTRSCR